MKGYEKLAEKIGKGNTRFYGDLENNTILFSCIELLVVVLVGAIQA